MSQYSDSNSIDDAPKAYQCFCCKNYTTYSGIYLHVKFKHTELFNKYKKMKITKLLKKKRLSDGSELYKLENILEQITEPLKTSQKQIVQSRPVNIEPSQPPNLPEETTANYVQHPPLAPHPYQFMYPLPLPHQFQNSAQYWDWHTYEAMHNYNSVYLPQLHPQAMVPYYRMNEAREQLFGQRNNIKAALEFYLKSHAQNGQKWEKLKTVLYDLIVYIDKSQERIGDKRTNQFVFLSYSDNFGFQLAAPLIEEFRKQLESRPTHSAEDVEEQLERSTYLKRLTKWISDSHLTIQSIQSSFETQNNPDENLTSYEKVEKQSKNSMTSLPSETQGQTLVPAIDQAQITK